VWHYFLNSTLFAMVHVVVTVFLGALIGFGSAKRPFPRPHLPVLLRDLHLDDPAPEPGGPLFIWIKALSWENSYAGLIIPGAMTAFGVFMMRQFASDLPDELPEAGRADGADEFHMFLRIVLPVLLPTMASVAIIVFIWSWSAFLWPLAIIQDRALTVERSG